MGAMRPAGRRGERRCRCPRGRARRPGAAAVPAVRGPPGARAPRWAGCTSATRPRGAPGRSSTMMPCRAANDPTTCRPRARDKARPTTGGLARRWFASATRSGGMPMPWSDTASTNPVAPTAPETTTAESGGENDVAFSSSSASRWATSDTARPDTARSSSMPTSSTRGKSAISAAAARTTSISAIGCCHCRGCSAPESTSRLSALRRMRVAMWSSLNSASSAVGSCSLRSSSSSSSSWRSSRLWLRRARFTNRSPMPLRSRRDCSWATSMVTASTSLNAWASSPISSSEFTSMRVGCTALDVATGAERLDQSRELALRHLARGGGEAAHRPDHRPRDEPDEHEREQHGEHRRTTVETGVAQRRGGVRARRRVDHRVHRGDRPVEPLRLLLVLARSTRPASGPRSRTPRAAAPAPPGRPSPLDRPGARYRSRRW